MNPYPYDYSTPDEEFEDFLSPDQPWDRRMRPTISLSIGADDREVMTSGRMARGVDEEHVVVLPDEPPPGWAER